MSIPLTSVSNPKIREAAALRESSERRKTGKFLIDGLREIRCALESGIQLTAVFLSEETPEVLEVLRQHSCSCPQYLISERCFDKIGFGNRNEGIIAAAQMPLRSLQWFDEQTKDCTAPLFAVLEGIEKPGNAGAVFRSADSAGLDGILLADANCDLFNPNVIRNSCGAVFCMPAAGSDTAAVISYLRSRRIKIAAARCGGAVPYTEFDFRQSCAIVLGSEADGLTELWNGDDVVPISLPMCGIADSLNVSNAAAVLFYEARRQRTL